MNSESSTIALLLVTYNRKELLDRILSEIQSFSWSYSRFVVVNNCSTDETSDVIARFQKTLELEVIQLNENIGHGAGLAMGLDFLKAELPSLDYVVFLEDDSIPTAHYLGFLLDKIEGTQYTMISSAGFLVSLGKRKALKPSNLEILTTDFALFDGAIARFQDLLKVGFPVRDWFMMFDDFEYCYRIRKEGFKIGVVTNPHLEILHEGWGGGVSHSNLWRSYYQSRNYIHFVRLHFTLWNLLDCLVLQSKRVIGGFFAVNGWRSTKMRILGIRAGIMGKKGRSLNLLSLKENI